MLLSIAVSVVLSATPPGAVLVSVNDAQPAGLQVVKKYFAAKGPVVDVTNYEHSLGQTNSLSINLDHNPPKWLPSELQKDFADATAACDGQVANQRTFIAAATAQACGEERRRAIWGRYLTLIKASEYADVLVVRQPTSGDPYVSVRIVRPSEKTQTAAVQRPLTSNFESSLVAALDAAHKEKTVPWDPAPPLPDRPKSAAGAYGSEPLANPGPIAVPDKCTTTLAPAVVVDVADGLGKTVMARYEKSVKTAKLSAEPLRCAMTSSTSQQEFAGTRVDVIDVKLTCGAFKASNSSMKGIARAEQMLDKASAGLVQSLIRQQCGMEKPGL